MYYDDVIARTAAGELVPLYMERTDGRRRWHLWVTPTDKERFLQDRPERPLAEAQARMTAQEIRRLVPQERDPTCHYGEDAWIRAELTQPRDNGAPIDASDWVSDPSPVAREIDGYLIPGDLIATQHAYYAAEVRCEQIAATHPRPTDIATGRARITNEQDAELANAREERLLLVEAIQHHPWWKEVDNRHYARLALYAAAAT